MLQRIAMLSLAACHDDPAVVDASSDGVDGADANDGACAPEFLDAIDDAQPDCATFVALPCGMPESATVSECYPDLTTCAAACSTHDLFYCVLTSSSCTLDGGMLDAATTLECVSCLGGGRRPRGFVAPSRGGRFARLAHMEAASVRAFRDLERSLVSFDAPARLVRAARRAREDEIRHARAMTRIARRFGETRPSLRIQRTTTPTLVELLADNAVEGCANETFGALLLTCEAERETDPRIRRTLRRVARDEANHAALAWEILRWGLPRISHTARIAVKRRLHDAFDVLERASPLGRALRAATAREIAW